MPSIVSETHAARRQMLAGQAREALTAIATVDIPFASLAIVRGECAYVLGDWPEAVRQFEAALRLSPSSPRAAILLELASEMVELTKTIRPQKSVEQLLGIPSSSDEAPKLPKIAISPHETAELEAPRKEQDEIGLVSETLADVMIRQGKFEEARKVYIQLARLNPDRYEYFRDKIKNVSNGAD